MIKFGDLFINKLSKQHIIECLDSNHITCGPKVQQFEQEFANLFGYTNTVMVNSGTSADMAACMALYEYGAKPGDEIICPALSFIATANAIRAAGFKPVFVDVELNSLNIDYSLVEDYITDKTVAIMGVNLMGKPCRMDILAEIAEKYDLKLIIDNAEAYGCQLFGYHALHYADFETTSHYIAHIITCGEGGTVSTNKDKDADLIYSIRSHGRKPDSIYFDHERFGLNFKPTDLCASIGLGEIDNFWDTYNIRKSNWHKITNNLYNFQDKIWFIKQDNCEDVAPHGISLTLKPPYNEKIDFLKDGLTKAEIQWKRNFGSMPEHPCFNYLDQNDWTILRLPRASYIGNYGIHIGCHQFLTDEDIEYINSTLTLLLKAI
jgi:dTDP-4-amino-4,6-dideoxygalactose transaminase